MRFQRRGRRFQPIAFSNRMRVSPTASTNSETILLEFVTTLQKPTAELPASIASYRKLYDSLTQAQQKNLIDKAANQILYAHSDIVHRTLKNLRKISLDLGQKTEVYYRKLLINR